MALASHQTSNEFEDITVTVPEHPGRVRGLTLAIVSSNTFVPGPGDPRRLGVQVDRIKLTPVRLGAFPPRRAVAVAAIAAAAFGAVFGLLGATATTAVGAATVLAVAQAVVLRHGLGPFGAWLGTVDRLAAGIGLALLLLTFVIERWRGERLRNTARFAMMFTGSVLYLKLLVLLHPDKWLIDAMFHAHRLEAVMGGSYVFTSIAPGGYIFPYPVGLYVTAEPLAWIVTDHILLLRLVAAGVEAVAALFFYWMIVRGSGDRLEAAVAVAVLQLMPLGFGVLAAANLTNVFGQAMALIAMSLVTIAVVTPDGSRPVLVGACVATLVAMLSLTSTVATLVGMLAMSSFLLILLGSGAAKRSGVRVAVVLLVAGAIAVGGYYSRFGATYEAQFARIRGEVAGSPQAVAPPSSQLYQPGGASVISRAMAVPDLASRDFTWPFAILALAGLVVGWRSRTDPFRLVIAGWLGACAVFLVLGVLTPVDFRHYYAAMPAVALLAARGIVWLWRTGPTTRAAAGVLAGGGAVIGVNNWLTVLGTPLF